MHVRLSILSSVVLKLFSYNSCAIYCYSVSCCGCCCVASAEKEKGNGGTPRSGGRKYVLHQGTDRSE